MSACDPLLQAERRCQAHYLDRSRWDLFPCRGSVVPCRTLPLVSAICRGTVKPRFARPAISKEELETPRPTSTPYNARRWPPATCHLELNDLFFVLTTRIPISACTLSSSSC